MRKCNGEIIYSPSDLITFMSDEFSSWMDRLYLEEPSQIKPDEDDESTKLIQNKGNEHELLFLKKLQLEGRDICEIDPDNKQAEALTIAAIEAGREIIYQGTLAKPPFVGRSDFLVRTDLQSNQKHFCYEIWDTKLSRKAKPYFIVQLCAYAEMLSCIQGSLPERIAVVLGSGETKYFRTDSFYHFYSSLKNRFLQAQESFDSKNPPQLITPYNLSRWRSYATSILEQRDDLLRIANIKKTQIKKLQEAGINTMSELAAGKQAPGQNLAAKTFETLQRQARLQIASKGLPRPKYEVLPTDPNNPRKGLALLPAYSPFDVFFDMEGYPHIEGGLEYLFGLAHGESQKQEFLDFWAHDRQSEKAAFEAFIDWVYDRWQKNPAMHIYHYGAYEVSALKRLMGRHGSRENEVDNLLRNEVFVDLYNLIRQGLCVGEDSYSIKKIEHLYLEARSGAVAKASDSIVYYERWLETQDGNDWHSSKLLTEIRNYNEIDCISTLKLANWLRTIQTEHNIAFLPKSSEQNQESDSATTKTASIDPAEKLARMLLAEIPPDKTEDPEHWRIQELLAHLLNFHRREEKPLWWKRFDRQAMTEEQLLADPECLAGLERTATPPIPIKESWGYEYSFNPKQDNKIEIGKFLFIHNFQQSTIDSLDKEKGVIVLKVGKKAAPPPQRVAIMPNEGAMAGPLKEAIYRLVECWHTHTILPAAITDLLGRTLPNINKLSPGSPIITAADCAQEEAIAAIMNLNSSYLCIQGPPGSGKTDLASKAILELIKAGKTIGVTSNSHKAIENLLERVSTLAKNNGDIFSGAKIVSEKQPENKTNTSFISEIKKDQLFAANAPVYQLIGATAWGFASPKADKKLDYLFVDEAGQVSLANMLAMSSSTSNIVLLGDQMQLDQPIQGSHPQESGLSILSYLLCGQAVIPANQGIFLPYSHRMHPAICAVVSNAIYEGRLTSGPGTENRKLLLTKSAEALLEKDAGLLFLPVEHEGNEQSSIEEAEAIKEMVKELIECQVLDKEGKNARPLGPEDILIVAPYNEQRLLLQKLLPNIEIGTVDKFQGRQAPVSILSLCSSDLESSPRGMEFLLSKNRLNVAISRAQTLSVVIGNPQLINTTCHTLEQMELVDFLCRIISTGSKSPFKREESVSKGRV